MGTSFKIVTVCILGAIIAIVSAELFLRHYDLANMRAGWLTWTEVDPSAPPPTYVNELGYRGAPIDYAQGDYVIVLVGDSQVGCAVCPDHRLPEDMLRGAFPGRNVKVFSLGAAGYGADQELLALRRYFRMGYRADLIVVWETLENDLYNAAFPNMAPVFGAGKLKPTFRLAPDGALVEPTGDIGDLFCRFYLSCVFKQLRYGSMDAYMDQWLPPPAQPIGAALPGTTIIDAGESIDHEKSTWSLWLATPSARTHYSINLTRALYWSISSLAAVNGAGFTLFRVNRENPIGLKELSGYAYFQDGPKTIRASGNLYPIGGHDVMHKTVAAVNAGFPFVAVEIDIPDHVVSPQDGHLNTRGTERVLHLLADALIEKGYLR